MWKMFQSALAEISYELLKMSGKEKWGLQPFFHLITGEKDFGHLGRH
jgi:hypothetical protein